MTMKAAAETEMTVVAEKAVAAVGAAAMEREEVKKAREGKDEMETAVTMEVTMTAKKKGARAAVKV